MALDTMGFIGGTDVLREISMRLEESHLAYLQLDESPLKLQAQKKLEGYIKEYLCHVPNERKYVFQETADILHRSAATVKDFSGYRACTAWRALSLYAANLLAQPWRKEYRTLRTYSGYYKHEIEANLVGGELMFELMGYKHTGFGVLTLEGPIDPDRVSNVSRDANVAFVECQILKDIWENVSQKFTISWLEVLEFRCNSVGTTEQAIRALNFRFLERLHREKNSTNIYHDYIHVVQPLTMPTTVSTIPLNSTIPSNIDQRGISNNYNTALLPNACKNEPNLYSTSDGTFYFSPISTTTATNRCVNPYACGTTTVNHYYPLQQGQLLTGCTQKLPILPGHATRVPTGRLIELDTPTTITNYDTTIKTLRGDDFSRKIVNSRSRDIPNDGNITRREKITRNHATNDESIDNVDHEQELENYAIIEKRSIGKLSRNLDTDENDDDRRDNDWGFVYKNLESLGYSKDLGERDNVLSRKKEALLQEGKILTKYPQKISRSLGNTEIRGTRDDDKTRQSKFDFAKSTINCNDRINFEACNEKRFRDIPVCGKKVINDQEDNGGPSRIEHKTFSIYEKNLKKTVNTLPSTKNIYRGTTEQNHGTMRKYDKTRESQDRKDTTRNFIVERWNCGTCTFLNTGDREICEMCGKSRRKGNEDKPLASGGKECPQCTLVNEKNADNCEACASSLKDSPTYI